MLAFLLKQCNRVPFVYGSTGKCHTRFALPLKIHFYEHFSRQYTHSIMTVLSWFILN